MTEVMELKTLLCQWMDLVQPDWRKTVRLGGDNPGNYFASKLQADTAIALVGTPDD